MKIVTIIFLLLCIVNLIQSQSGVDSETEVMGDSGWWSTRISKINRKGIQQIGPAGKDNQRDDGPRQQDEEEDATEGEKVETAIRNSRRRSRPFASVLPSNAGTRFRDRFESRKENNPKENGTPRDFILRIPQEPSPILQPPLPPSSSVYRINIFEGNATTSESNNESSLNNGKSDTLSALERIRIYEITTSNSTKNETDENGASHADDNESSKLLRVNDAKRHWTNFTRDPYDNRTKYRNKHLSEERGNILESFYIDENRRNEETMSLKTFRGNGRYQKDLHDDEDFMRKRNFFGSDKYELPRRIEQRSNRLKFMADTNTEVGSVPGVPGRDYPIHQEHTHHHLRNIIDRFPCPRKPKTHVYLPDRASRCQIFYVCYGSKTGVPMVCPNGTLFNEPLQVCDWWYNVSC